MTEIRIAVADLAAAAADAVLLTVGLGSCVAIALYDPVTRVGGLAHILLPNESLSRNADNPAKFATTAIPALIGRMRDLGMRGRPVAKLAGGASMFASLLPSGGVNMGDRNVEATRRVLREHAIPILAADVGGEHGRTVYFHTTDGRLVVRSIRAGERVL